MEKQDITDETLSAISQEADGQAAVEAKGEEPTDGQTEGQNQEATQDGETSGQSEATSEEKKAVQDNPADFSLDDINSTLGKNFSSKDEALKSIKDTYNFVGKKQDDVAGDLKAKGYMTEQDFENRMFYKDNPEHADNKEVLDAIAKDKGVSLAEAAKTDSYKRLFEGASNFEKTQAKKSVAETNPRLAGIEDKAKSVQELSQSGSKEAAGNEAAKAVIEAYGLE